jgi:hypothetical protein
VQELPSQLRVERVQTAAATSFRLRFRAAVFDSGEGPLMIFARRAAQREPTMTVSQVVTLADGRALTYPRAGAMRFEATAMHGHWHYLDFERYALLGRAGGAALARGHKAGFCLGDRYRVSPAVTTFPVFLFETCDRGRPNVLSTGAGISVGFGDDYPANVAGQYLDVTHLRSGHYALVNQVNPRRLLRESSYSNDTASLLIDLSWPRGRSAAPLVRVRAACPAGTRQAPCLGST